MDRSMTPRFAEPASVPPERGAPQGGPDGEGADGRAAGEGAPAAFDAAAAPPAEPGPGAAIALHLVGEEAAEAWLAGLPAPAARWLGAHGFRGRVGQAVAVPAEDGAVAMVAAGLGGEAQRARVRFAAAAAWDRLPAGAYRIATGPAPGPALDEAALGWLLAPYRYDRFKRAGGSDADGPGPSPEAAAEGGEGAARRSGPAPAERGPARDVPEAAPATAPGAAPQGPRGASRAEAPAGARLVAPEGVDAARLEAIAAGEVLTRDLINAPASHLGPAELEAAARDLAQAHGAAVEATRGEALAQGFPLIEAVGRASPRAPRLIDLRWGARGPSLTLVGKGICFDTGGLDLKPSAAMALMKKDMGGAAVALGLAQTVMALGLPLRLRVLIPAAENAVSGAAMRPGDVLRARGGASVEVNNTDAEGRLVLADALAYAAEGAPDLLVSMATLTGAARVALGPDIAPFFTDDDALAQALSEAGARARDPVWRLPFHAPYEAMIEPEIADLDNAPQGGFAGAITAALFLRRFAGGARFLHFDLYGWQPQAAPARPKGGVGQGARALLEALPQALGLGAR